MSEGLNIIYDTLDRFSRGLPDRQEAKVEGYCAACGGEIYEGEGYFQNVELRINWHDRKKCKDEVFIEYFNCEKVLE